MSNAASGRTDGTMTLTAHLLELRRRLMHAVLALVIVTAAMIPFMQEIFAYLSAPLYEALPKGTKLLAVSVISPVTGPLKTVLFCAFTLTLPHTVYQIWLFAAPGLFRNERRLIAPLLISSFVMFVAGIAYCYFVVFRFVFVFIASFAPGSVNFAPDIDAFIGFALHLFLAFGVAFEIPVAVIVLAAAGAVSIEKLRRIRRYVIVGAVALAAVITPPDVTSQLLLALPMILLYELGLVIASLCCRHRAAVADAA